MFLGSILRANLGLLRPHQPTVILMVHNKRGTPRTPSVQFWEEISRLDAELICRITHRQEQQTHMLQEASHGAFQHNISMIRQRETPLAAIRTTFQLFRLMGMLHRPKADSHQGQLLSTMRHQAIKFLTDSGRNSKMLNIVVISNKNK